MGDTDPFLLGLLAGVIVGFAGIAERVLQVAALVGVALLAWVLANDGLAGLEAALSELYSGVLLPNLRLAAGLALGGILGTSVSSALKTRSH